MILSLRLRALNRQRHEAVLNLVKILSDRIDCLEKVMGLRDEGAPPTMEN